MVEVSKFYGVNFTQHKGFFFSVLRKCVSKQLLKLREIENNVAKSTSMAIESSPCLWHLILKGTFQHDRR